MFYRTVAIITRLFAGLESRYLVDGAYWESKNAAEAAEFWSARRDALWGVMAKAQPSPHELRGEFHNRMLEQAYVQTARRKRNK